MGKSVTRILGELDSDSNGVLIVTDGRPIEYPEGIDISRSGPRLLMRSKGIFGKK